MIDKNELITEFFRAVLIGCGAVYLINILFNVI